MTAYSPPTVSRLLGCSFFCLFRTIKSSFWFTDALCGLIFLLKVHSREALWGIWCCEPHISWFNKECPWMPPSPHPAVALLYSRFIPQLMTFLLDGTSLANYYWPLLIRRFHQANQCWLCDVFNNSKKLWNRWIPVDHSWLNTGFLTLIECQILSINLAVF